MAEETTEQTAARLAKEASDKATKDAADKATKDAADKAAKDAASNAGTSAAFLDEFAGLKKFVGYVHSPAGTTQPASNTAPTHDPAKCLFGPFCPYGHESA